MAPASRTTAVTFDEFCLLVNGEQKADLIDGVIYLASPDNTDANEIFMWFGGLLFDYVQDRDLGKVYGARVAFKVIDTDAPEPDIGFIRKSRLGVLRRGSVGGAHDLAVEIVSPESVERDYVVKRQEYEQAGTREYWIVDEMKQKVTLLRLAKAKFHPVRPRKGVLASRVLPGFWLRLSWLWQKPLPKKTDALNEILGYQ
jgi:Uma2 family endonuclease